MSSLCRFVLFCKFCRVFERPGTVAAEWLTLLRQSGQRSCSFISNVPEKAFIVFLLLFRIMRKLLKYILSNAHGLKSRSGSGLLLLSCENVGILFMIVFLPQCIYSFVIAAICFLRVHTHLDCLCVTLWGWLRLIKSCQWKGKRRLLLWTLQHCYVKCILL